MAPLHPARTTCINVKAYLVEVVILVGLLPRHMSSSRWHAIERRVRQRVRHFLSDAEWRRFARYARSRHKKAFERFVRRGLRCCGTLEGDPCPFGAKEIGTCHLHLDHEVELSHVCRVWERDYAACRLLQLARGSTEPWDHIRKDLLCQLLFGTTPMVLSDCSVAPPNLCCRCCFSRGEGCHSADVHRSRNATLTTFLPASGGNFMLR